MGKKLQKKKKNRNHMHNPNQSKLNIANVQKFSSLEEISSTSLFNDPLALTEKDHEVEKEEEENTDDLISSLPDEILFRIISFFPFHSALNTRALSTQWNKLWLCNATLIIKHGCPADIAPAITEFLDQFNDPDSLKKFQRLQFHFSKYHQILLASVGLNRKLHLDFSQVEEEVLGKFWWLEQDWGNYSFIHKLSPSLSSIKTLKLTSVNYTPAPNICISNLKLLESLVIIRCNAVRYLCIRNVPKLQNIIVSDCPLLTELCIEGAYELGSLRIRGELPYIRLQGNFSLKDALLEGPDYDNLKCTRSDSLQQKIRLVKILTLCRWIFENWLLPVLFHHLKDLWWIDSSVDEQNIDALFSFLKNCPSLERLFITIDPKSCGMRSTIGKPPSNARSCTKQGHLKVVKLENLIDEEGVIFLAEKLLEAFDIENLVIVASDGNYLRSLVRIPVKRATQRGKFYKFVEDFDDNNGLRLKHAHMGS